MIKPQYQNKLVSSFMLYLDNKILTKGEAYTNHQSLYFPTQNLYNGFQTYSAPFSQIVADSSISGANIMSGVYLGGTFITKGASGLHEINYNRNQVYFSGAQSSAISGNYAIKDYNIKITSEPEITLLFETKYKLRPKYQKSLSGLAPNEETYPIIYIRKNGGENEPYAFGGENLTETRLRLVILSDSAFSLDAVESIIQDIQHDYVPIFEEHEQPFNMFGGLVSGIFNYTGMVQNKIPNDQAAFVKEVMVAPFNQNIKSEVADINTNIFAGFVDIILVKNRFPKQE